MRATQMYTQAHVSRYSDQRAVFAGSACRACRACFLQAPICKLHCPRLYVFLAIQMLPDSVGEMKGLVLLSLHNNELKILPDTIGNLQNLTTL